MATLYDSTIDQSAGPYDQYQLVTTVTPGAGVTEITVTISATGSLGSKIVVADNIGAVTAAPAPGGLTHDITT